MLLAPAIAGRAHTQPLGRHESKKCDCYDNLIEIKWRGIIHWYKFGGPYGSCHSNPLFALIERPPCLMRLLLCQCLSNIFHLFISTLADDKQKTKYIRETQIIGKQISLWFLVGSDIIHQMNWNLLHVCFSIESFWSGLLLLLLLLSFCVCSAHIDKIHRTN